MISKKNIPIVIFDEEIDLLISSSCSVPVFVPVNDVAVNKILNTNIQQQQHPGLGWQKSLEHGRSSSFWSKQY